MHIDAPRLTMMDLTTNHRWIGVRLHLEAGYAVPMDVTALKVTLGMDGEIQIQIQNDCMSYQKYFLVHELQLKDQIRPLCN